MSCGACCFHRLPLCLQGHLFHTHTLRLTSSNLVRSDVLLRGNIGKPLVLIMLYSHLFPLFCLLITIHSCSVCLCVCVRILFILRACAWTVCTLLEQPPSPPSPPPKFMRKSIAQAPPLMAARWSCGIGRACQPNGMDSRAVQIKSDWIEPRCGFLHPYEALAQVEACERLIATCRT